MGDATCEEEMLLSVAPNQRHLVTSDGKPFQLRGDAAWAMAVQLQREEIATYLDARRAQGFNAVLIELIERKFGRAAPANAYGDQPFVGGDFASPNEPYWQHVDQIVAAARVRQMVVLMSALYLGFEGGDEGWYQSAQAAGPQQVQRYGEFLGARYQRAGNVIWVNGGDFRPPTLAIPDALAAGILAKDKRHLMTTHWARDSAGTDGSPSWLTLNSSYTDTDNAAQLVAAAYQGQPKLPVFLIEARYEGTFAGSEGQPTLTAQQVRGQLWQALLSGGCGYVFGNHTVWPFAAGWPAALDSEGARSMQNAFELFDSIAWWTLEPSAIGALVTAGQGEPGSGGFAPAAVASDGKLAVIYVPDGRALTLDMSKFSSTVAATWLDPASGQKTDVAGAPFPPNGTQLLDAPGTSDAVLLLEAK
jgi:hypothetical protein